MKESMIIFAYGLGLFVGWCSCAVWVKLRLEGAGDWPVYVFISASLAFGFFINHLRYRKRRKGMSANTGKKVAETAPKSHNHIHLQEKIGALANEIDVVEVLLNRVKGGKSSEIEKSAPVEILNLGEFLKTGGTIIENQTNRLGSIIQELKEILF